MMNNVEPPNHYQLNVKLEVLDIINLIVSNKSLPKSDAFVVENAVKYLALAFDSLYHLEIRNTLRHLTSHVIGKALSED